MENKKYLPMKVIHLILMICTLVGLVYYFFGAFSHIGADILYDINILSPILAVISGLVYFFMGYKKKAALFYKIFMALFLLEFVSSVLSGMTALVYDMIPAILEVLTLICLALLFEGKDLGKTKSSVLVVIVVVCRIIMLILTFTVSAEIMKQTFGAGLSRYVIRLISEVLLAGSAGLMVVGKYLDKAERGTK